MAMANEDGDCNSNGVTDDDETIFKSEIYVQSHCFKADVICGKDQIQLINEVQRFGKRTSCINMTHEHQHCRAFMFCQLL